MKTIINTTILLSVEIDEYTLGNKYDAITFEISNGHAQGRKGKGKSFKSPVERGATVTWTGKGSKGASITIREISPKDQWGNHNLLDSIDYKNNEAIGIIKDEIPEGVEEFYNITIAIKYKGHTFPDFTIDPIMEIHDNG